MAGVSSRPYEGVDPAEMTAEFAELNGAGAMIFHGAGRVIATLSVDLDPDGRITAIHNIANPDKLRDVAARTVHLLT
jgi:RNA polymerase sigma-70 factor (ECF subfamily)